MKHIIRKLLSKAEPFCTVPSSPLPPPFLLHPLLLNCLNVYPIIHLLGLYKVFITSAKQYKIPDIGLVHAVAPVEMKALSDLSLTQVTFPFISMHMYHK